MSDKENVDKVKNILEVKVIESEKTLYSGKAKSITSINDVGRFDVLPSHQSFISIIIGTIVIETEDREKIQLKIGQGILKCVKNKVEILIGLESL